jgi:hypothetical protein
MDTDEQDFTDAERVKKLKKNLCKSVQCVSKFKVHKKVSDSK